LTAIPSAALAQNPAQDDIRIITDCGAFAVAPIRKPRTGERAARRFEACRRELDAAVRSAKTLDAFSADERRGWYRTYSREQRRELLEHVKTRDHTEHDYSAIAAMSDTAHTSAVFNIGDMVYVLFFDRDNRLRSYACLSN
jgi:hypothetical protein